MKYIVPAYYRDFGCIASACRHSCCVGWEVDVDEETLALYNAMQHPYAEKIRDSIDTADTPHFRLDARDRCPHLAEDGLCNIITECGEQALCLICRDHPRYRNFYEGVTELGLGLSCEEAARLALADTGGFLVSDVEEMTSAAYYPDYPCELFSEEERTFAEEKRSILSLITDRTRSITERLSILLPKMPSVDETRALYLSLETLDKGWRKRIELLSAEDFERNLEKSADYVERILAAVIYRHLNLESFYDAKTVGAFAALSARLVAALATDASDFADTLRAHSAEVEYSTENTERILDFLEERLYQ